MLTDDEYGFLNEALLGDQYAIEFCRSLFRISQVWDDLIDGDEAVDAESINAAFWEALVTIPLNPFYRNNFTTLQPLVQAAIIDWLAANDLERGSQQEQVVAFVLRDTLTSIITHCALIVGGYQHMRDVNPVVRRKLHDESIAEYLQEHADG